LKKEQLQCMCSAKCHKSVLQYLCTALVENLKFMKISTSSSLTSNVLFNGIA
jgi:hypothetical protein